VRWMTDGKWMPDLKSVEGYGKKKWKYMCWERLAAKGDVRQRSKQAGHW